MNTLPDGPVAVYDIELTGELPRLTDPTESGVVRVLARMHGRPVADLRIPVPRCGMEPDGVRAALGELIARTDRRTEPGSPSGRSAAVGAGPSFTILIATHDRTELLLRCLHSISLLEYRNFDVVVIDNCPSSDDTRHAVAAWQKVNQEFAVRYLNEPRAGAALAHNRGLAAATGSWIARTDDDVVVDPKWLSAIAEVVVANPGVECVTGLILSAEVNTPAQELLEEFGGYARGFEQRSYDLAAHRPVGDRLFPFTMGRLGSGANMAFDAAKLRARGGFDVALGPGTPARGGEDLFALFQVITSGGRVVYEPSALVWHWNRREYESLRRLVHDYGIGLAAYLTSAMLHEPRLLPTMLRQAVPGALHTVRRSSAKNKGKRAGYPRELERLELLGMMKGPLAYLASRFDRRAAT